MLATATRELLTPYGLRTLAPSDPAYRGRYGGGAAERDSAYHQGTVWPYLMGSYVDLYRRVHGQSADISAPRHAAPRPFKRLRHGQYRRSVRRGRAASPERLSVSSMERRRTLARPTLTFVYARDNITGAFWGNIITLRPLHFWVVYWQTGIIFPVRPDTIEEVSAVL